MMISDEPARQAVHLREDEVPLLHEVALDGVVPEVLVGLGQPFAALALDFSQRLRRSARGRRGRHGGHCQPFRHQITSGHVCRRRAAAQFREAF